jgi:glycosyltransferase involved in cell wall biosynthesis
MEFNGISITVCCYNDGVLLPNFLDSFIALHKVNCPVELNVIDNASTDDTKLVFESYKGQFEKAQFEFNYFYEHKRGLNHARNRGIEEAKFTHIGFTDADAKFHVDYLKILAETIQTSHSLIIFGPYFPWYNTEKPHWYKDEYNSYCLKQTAGFVNDAIYPNGINMVYELKSLKETGSFSTEIVYKGINDRGEETELFYRYKNKFKDKHIYYDPQLVVYHYTRPKTMHLCHWIKSNWGTGKNHAKFMNTESAGKNLKDMIWILKTVFLSTLKYFFKVDNGKFNFYQNFLIEDVFSHVYAFSLAYHRIIKK